MSDKTINELNDTIQHKNDFQQKLIQKYEDEARELRRENRYLRNQKEQLEKDRYFYGGIVILFALGMVMYGATRMIS